MSTVSPANPLSISVRTYRALLVVYPKQFREHYETGMVQVFRDSFRDAYRRGGTSGAIDLWIHTCADLLVSALIERIAEGSQVMLSPRIVFWGGLAAALGGIMWVLPVLSAKNSEAALSLALLLTLAGLAALHARQGKQAGALSWAGLILGTLGTGLAVSFLIWTMNPGHSLDPARNPGVGLEFAEFALGMGILGIGDILIGLRTLQNRVQARSTSAVTMALGVLHFGFGVCLWMTYDLMAKGIDPWSPMTVPVTAILLLMFVIGILWLVLGAILAGQSGWRAADQPAATAQTPR